MMILPELVFLVSRGLLRPLVAQHVTRAMAPQAGSGGGAALPATGRMWIVEMPR
jgi:hypothetical protein